MASESKSHRHTGEELDKLLMESTSSLEAKDREIESLKRQLKRQGQYHFLSINFTLNSHVVLTTRTLSWSLFVKISKLPWWNLLRELPLYKTK